MKNLTRRCFLLEELAQDCLLGRIDLLYLDRLTNGYRTLSSRRGLKMGLNSSVTLVWRRGRIANVHQRMVLPQKTVARVRPIPKTRNA
jgi:hypothetical protein